jgi:hypothetical protein
MSSNQVQQRKYYPCRKGCGTQLTFDNAHKSQTGKFIPLEKDSIGQLQAHQCPLNNNKNNVMVTPSGTQQVRATTQKNDNEQLKEIRSIKAQLLVLVNRLSNLEKELGENK